MSSRIPEIAFTVLLISTIFVALNGGVTQGRLVSQITTLTQTQQVTLTSTILGGTVTQSQSSTQTQTSTATGVCNSANSCTTIISSSTTGTTSAIISSSTTGTTSESTCRLIYGCLALVKVVWVTLPGDMPAGIWVTSNNTTYTITALTLILMALTIGAFLGVRWK